VVREKRRARRAQQQTAEALADDGSEMDWEPGMSDDNRDNAVDGGRRKGQRRRQGYG
jgi:hypothetical protein